MDTTFEYFNFNVRELQLLFSLEKTIVDYEIEHIKKYKFKYVKKMEKEWLNEWKININNFLATYAKTNKLTCCSSDPQIIGGEELNKLITSVREESKDNAKLAIILLECCAFKPYEPISKEYKKNIIYNTTLHHNVDYHKKACENIADKLGLEKERVDKFIKSYKEAGDKIGDSHLWQCVLGGALVVAVAAVVFTPAIAGLFAAEGLSGAAATASGLSALGCGAVATGGAGMAGGMTVIVGGGAILGATAGDGVYKLMAASPNFTVSESAKIEVVIKEIVIKMHNDILQAQEILKKQNDTILILEKDLKDAENKSKEYEKQITELKLGVEGLKAGVKELEELAKKKQEIKNLKQSIKYLGNGIERNRQIIAGEF